jgi:putative transposase
VRKLTNKKVQWIIRLLEEGNHPEDIARFVRVSRRRIYQLKQQYKDDGHIPELKDPGRKKKPLDPECERIILDVYHTYKSGPVILEKIIKIHYDRIRKIFTKIFISNSYR